MSPPRGHRTDGNRDGQAHARARGAGPGAAAMWLAALLICVALPLSAIADEDTGVQVKHATEEIALHPDDAELYLRRAELYRSRREWAAGLADLQTAKRLNPDLAAIELSLARLLLAADNPQQALVAIDSFLSLHGDHAGAHLMRARILVRLGSRREAVDEFTRGIDLARRSGTEGKGPQPDDYLERARLLACDDIGQVAEAIRGLDEGVVALRGAITLQLLAIDLELARRNWDAALDRLAAVEARANRKETWMARRADILAQAGRVDEASRAYAAALAAIEALPERLRSTGSTAELASRVREGLAAARTGAAGPNHSVRLQLSGDAGCPPPVSRM